MNNETRYVLCDSCDKKIYLGSEVYCFDGYCGVYCSTECYAEAHATIKVIDEEEAENFRCDIWDDKAAEKEKEKIEREISELQNKLKQLKNITTHTKGEDD